MSGDDDCPKLNSNTWKYCAPQNDMDTEWHDILRKKGILDPQIKDDDLADLIDKTVEAKVAGNSRTTHNKEDLDAELDDAADSDEERFLEQYRRQRIKEMKEAAAKSKFGSVVEISKADWKREVNDVKDCYVVVLITRQGLVASKIAEQAHSQVASRFPQVKFVRGAADACIPNYPDANVPTILVYKDDQLVTQWVGLDAMGGNKFNTEVLEWLLSKVSVLETLLESDPRDDMKSNLLKKTQVSDDEDDW